MAEPTLKARKDHGASAAAASELVPITVGSPLVFHVSPSTEPPFRVDLTEFADGADPTSIAYRRGGPFTGRPELIADLAPTIRLRFSGQTHLSTKAAQQALRMFWRFLDTLPPALAPQRLAHSNEVIGGL